MNRDISLHEFRKQYEQRFNGRRLGRIARQMHNAPIDAIFICATNDVRILKEMAILLGRTDLKINPNVHQTISYSECDAHIYLKDRYPLLAKPNTQKED